MVVLMDAAKAAERVSLLVVLSVDAMVNETVDLSAACLVVSMEKEFFDKSA